MLSVKTFSYLLAFTMTYFPLSPSAKPVDTSPISPNLLSKRLDYAVRNSRSVFLPDSSTFDVLTAKKIQMHCTGRLYFTNAELSWQGLQSPSAYNYDREQWCQDTEEDGGNCVCHDDGTLTCDPASLGGQHAAPLECETPCHCLQLDPNTPDIHETVRETLPPLLRFFSPDPARRWRRRRGMRSGADGCYYYLSGAGNLQRESELQLGERLRLLRL